MSDHFKSLSINKYSSGEQHIALDQFKTIYNSDRNVKVKAVKLKHKIWLSFETFPKMVFYIHDISSLDSLSFVTNLDTVDAWEKEVGFFAFFSNELFQGNTFQEKAFRFLHILIPTMIFNYFLIKYGKSPVIETYFTNIITASALFISIFTIFVASTEYLKRKRILVFRSGSLGYWFSIDKNMCLSSFISIITSLFGNIVLGAQNFSTAIVPTLTFEFIILMFLINVSFVLTYILLRSMYEFYVTRPAAFVMGDLKKEFLSFKNR